MDNRRSKSCVFHDPLILCPECSGGICGICGICRCGRSIPVDGGILRFLSQEDTFYEGAYRAQVHFNEASLRRPGRKLLLPFINYGYLKLILDSVSPGSRVLELGSGSGIQLAGERFLVTAVDLSHSSLKETPASYRHRIQADVMEIDFLPARFDAVVGSCFYEHIDRERKGILLAKIWQWLRPGGVLILLFDTESANPFFKKLRKDPVLYRQCLVEHDGHIGMELASTNRELFRKQGFEEILGIGLNRTLQHLPVYTWVAPYGISNRYIRYASGFFDRVGRNVTVSRVFTASLHIWDLSLGRFFPLDWSRLYLGCWRRT